MNKNFFKKQSGFTLTESIIVIIILAVLIGTVITLFWPGRSIELRAQADQLANDIRYTQSLSMSQNERYRIDLSQANQYRILDSSGNPITHPATASTIINLESDFSMSSSTNYLVFDARGTPYSSSSSTGSGTLLSSNLLIILTEGSHVYTITVTPKTGYVSVG